MEGDVLIIGGGPAGMETASRISDFKRNVILVEKERELGGHILKWDRLFPDGILASDITNELKASLGNTKVILGSYLASIEKRDDYHFVAQLSSGEIIRCSSVVLATGFKLFPAQKKQEYGYGLYDRVITNEDLETRFKKSEGLGKEAPKRVGFVHCVGSRDEKICNKQCSKLCCITAVKQAIELKQLYPDAEIFCFYMDLRMYGRGYEDLYLEAQSKYGIRFIRGRVSEISQDQSGLVIVKAEDTLASRPLKITLDWVILMAGIISERENDYLTQQLSLQLGEDGFINSLDPIIKTDQTNIPGVFVTGSATGPKTLPEVLSEARSTALTVNEYLNKIKNG
ncbi:MAG: FAD-dependent oxidoreductase [Bacteroidetes bacterium HGW-Bacteroidetes-5]|jgi:heterodisulfide reductase subunit A|nr:MAG: FAD-dependent oxidoreductase [Bacteroidetes bacterium HGW-Bacteroidetes-5]